MPSLSALADAGISMMDWDDGTIRIVVGGYVQYIPKGDNRVDRTARIEKALEEMYDFNFAHGWDAIPPQEDGEDVGFCKWSLLPKAN